MLKSFNAKNLSTLMEKCNGIPEYHAVIILKDASRVAEFAAEARLLFNRNSLPNVKSILNRHDEFNIEFFNGSTIKVIAPLINVRGYIFHDGLIEDGVEASEMVAYIENTIAQHIFQRSAERIRDGLQRVTVTMEEFNRTFKPIWQDNEVKIDADSKEEMDNFLSSFTINNSFEVKN